MKTSPVEGDEPDVIRVLLADDHALMRTGLRLLLETEPGVKVVGEASDGAEALRLATVLRPNVVLADVSMPPPDGIELARQLTEVLPETKTLIVTMHEDRALVQSALAAGAAGYVVKRAGPLELVEAIRLVAAGQVYVDPQLAPVVPRPRKAGE